MKSILICKRRGFLFKFGKIFIFKLQTCIFFYFFFLNTFEQNFPRNIFITQILSSGTMINLKKVKREMYE